MKKVVSIILTLALLGSALISGALAEDGFFSLFTGVDIDLNNGRYTVMGDQGDCMMMDSEDGSMYSFQVYDERSLGYTSSVFKSMVFDRWETAKVGNMRLTAAPKAASGFEWAPFTLQSGASTLNGLMVLTSNCLIFISFQAAESLDVEAVLRVDPSLGQPQSYEALDSVTTAAPAETPAPTQAPEQPNSVSGAYDQIPEDGGDSALLVLSGGNLGRISGGGKDISFHYTFEGGYIAVDDPSMTLTLTEEGAVYAMVSGQQMYFVKQAPYGYSPVLAGEWKTDQVKLGGAALRGDMLESSGLAVEFTAYADGTLEWRPLNEKDAPQALAWQVDDEGLYLDTEDGVMRCYEGKEPVNALYINWAKYSQIIEYQFAKLQ